MLARLIYIVLMVVAVCQAQTLKAPALTSAQVEQCKTLAGLTQLAASVPEVKSAAKGQSPDAVAAAANYWIWGYPLLNTAKATITSGINIGAINKLYTQSQLLAAKNQGTFDIVAPSSDTLYQTGWLDLTKGPMVLYAPDTNGRFYVLELLDFWTNVIGNPGAPTTGTAASKWVVIPPGYKKDTLPAAYRNLPAYYSNTTAVWIIGRVYVKGPEDLPAAQAVQKGIGEMAVNNASTQATFLRDTATKANNLLKAGNWTLRTVNNATDAFVAIAGLANAFPAPAETSEPNKGATKLGIQPSKGFDQPKLNPDLLNAGFVLGQACINSFSTSGQLGVALPTGWTYTTKAGLYGNNYLIRAAVALLGIGANSPEVTIYAINLADSKKQPLSGAGGAVYTITFPSIPPFKYFSSVTAYAVSNNLLMPNPYSDRANINFKATPGLQYEKNGSLTMWLSQNPPGPKGSKELANWLPIGAVPFWVTLRVYGPSESLIQGKVPLPPIIRVK